MTADVAHEISVTGDTIGGVNIWCDTCTDCLANEWPGFSIEEVARIAAEHRATPSSSPEAT